MGEAQAAVAIVHAQDPEESVLLIRRTERADDPWSGHWSFPGGRRDPEDPDLLHTALRELYEECGIRLGPEHLEATLPPTPAGRRMQRTMIVAPFLFRVDKALPATPDPHEVAEAVWIPLSVLRDPARHSLVPVPRVPPEMAFPAIELSGVPLWGFTYRVIREWLGLQAGSSAACPGFEAARLLLEFLLSQGLMLEHGWEERESEGRPIRVARVRGAIPEQAVRQQVAAPRAHFPTVHSVEIRADSIRIIGMGLEEYVIEACETGKVEARA